MCASTFTAGLLLIFCLFGIAAVISVIVGFIQSIRREKSHSESISN
jgi:hypothetical protein